MLDEVRIYPTALSASQVLQRYTETKDGLSSSNSIAAQETSVGETWRCQVIPNDSWQDGTAINSPTITVGSTPPPQYNLQINSASNGNTNPTAGTYVYNQGTTATVEAIPNNNYQLSYWLRNGTNVGTANPYSMTMNTNYELTPVFEEIPQQTEFTLTVNVIGDGSVSKNPNQATYTAGTNVVLTATPAESASFLGWSGDATGTEQTITISMTSNKAVTATFSTVEPQTQPVFEDGFESGTFDAYSSTTRTTGETTSIASNIVHIGSRSGCFTTSGDGSYERAYASRSGLNLGEVYTSAYVYVDQSGIADNTDRFYFIQMMAGSNILAYGGWRQDTSGNLHWHIMIRDGSTTVGAYSATTPVTGSWYHVELHWKADATTGFGELYVDGNLVASITDRNTANYGNATIARLGIPELYNCAPTTVYIDDVVVSTSGTEPTEPQTVYLTIGSSSYGTTNPTIGSHPYQKDTVATISATPSSGYTLSGWLIDGTTMPNNNPYQITMNTDHSVTPLFAETTQTYQLTVTTSGSGTTSITGTTQYSSGQNVAVQATANSGWQLSHWLLNSVNVGSANPYTVTMNTNYVLTAVFTEIPVGEHILDDGFESGNFNAWTTTSSTSGETANVETNPVYAGNYAATFTSSGDGGYEKAYAIESLSDSLGEVFVQCNFKLTQSDFVDNGDRMKLIELRSGNTIIAAAGLAMRSGILRLWLETRDGTSYIETYGSTADISDWFTIELQWTESTTTGGATLWVNGAQVLQTSNQNTGNYGDCTEVRVGMAELYNCGNTILSADNAVIDNQYIA